MIAKTYYNKTKSHHKLPSLELQAKAARWDTNQYSALAVAIPPPPTKEAKQPYQFLVRMSAEVLVQSGGESSTTLVGNQLP